MAQIWHHNSNKISSALTMTSTDSRLEIKYKLGGNIVNFEGFFGKIHYFGSIVLLSFALLVKNTDRY